MNLETLLYISAVGIATVFSFLAIRVRHILYATVFLTGMYIASAWALIQLGAWFLAIIYLIINAGGVLILIIFASMLTRPAIDIPPSKQLSLNGIILTFSVVFLLFLGIFFSYKDINTNLTSNYFEISKLFFSDYFITILILAVASLAVYLGAIYIAYEEK